MPIIPTIRCTSMRRSLAFYTRVLEFELAGGDGETDDPCFNVLTLRGERIFLSSHAGDGVAGQAFVVTTVDVDADCARFRAHGLATPGDPSAPREVHEGPLDQTWGTREFYVRDPDGNSIRFVQGLPPG